jgi:hypothetical protein
LINFDTSTTASELQQLVRNSEIVEQRNFYRHNGVAYDTFSTPQYTLDGKTKIESKLCDYKNSSNIIPNIEDNYEATFSTSYITDFPNPEDYNYENYYSKIAVTYNYHFGDESLPLYVQNKMWYKININKNVIKFNKSKRYKLLK